MRAPRLAALNFTPLNRGVNRIYNVFSCCLNPEFEI